MRFGGCEWNIFNKHGVQWAFHIISSQFENLLCVRERERKGERNYVFEIEREEKGVKESERERERKKNVRGRK